MRVAGLDPSLTNTGIAIIDGHGSPRTLRSGTLDGAVTPVRRGLHSIGWGGEAGASYLDRNRRGRELAGSVMSYVISFDPDVISIEAPIPNALPGRGNQHDLVWLFGLLLAECDLRGIPTVIVNPRTRQKWLTGNGNASKPVLLEACREFWPARIANADISDALICALLVLHRQGYAMPFEVKERHTNNLDTIDWRDLDRAAGRDLDRGIGSQAGA